MLHASIPEITSRDSKCLLCIRIILCTLTYLGAGFTVRSSYLSFSYVSPSTTFLPFWLLVLLLRLNFLHDFLNAIASFPWPAFCLAHITSSPRDADYFYLNFLEPLEMCLVYFESLSWSMKRNDQYVPEPHLHSLKDSWKLPKRDSRRMSKLTS